MGTPHQQQLPFDTKNKMPPRFLQRLERQTEAYKQAFGGEPKFDPPPYPISTPRSSISDAPSQRSPPPQYSQLSHRPSYHYEHLALPPNSLVLVTGANGWQGMHVVDQLLKHGYRVRGTVRDADKAIWTSTYFKEKYGAGAFTTAIVPDVVPRGSLHVAVQGCAGVVHCCSVMSFSSDPTQVITPTIAGALNALEAAAEESHVKRVVYCSGSVAAVSSGTGTRTEVTSESWNMSAFLTAWQPPPYEDDRAWSVYASSKLQTEQAVWRWYTDHRPHFTLNTGIYLITTTECFGSSRPQTDESFNAVLPGTLWGKQLSPGYQGYRTSVKSLKAIFDGDTASTTAAPARMFPLSSSFLVYAC